jgi:tyrosinase
MRQSNHQPTRREVLAMSLAAGVACLLPENVLALPNTPQTAKWTRHEVNTTKGQEALEIFKDAVEKMLKLPLDDPRNWYRQGTIHLLDCPHGNWWFFNWHRPFLGYFEQICREVTKQDSFALPYWDWTANPVLPESFWKPTRATNILDPGSDFFIEDGDKFVSAMETPIKDYLTNLSTAQKSALTTRWNFDDWNTLKIYLKQFYPGRSKARGAKANIGELVTEAQDAVKATVIKLGLDNESFDDPANVNVAFNAGITSQHSGSSGLSAIIEGQPHNWVHNSISGLMGLMLSPIDPIFWLHHANIDRIWTAWAKLQHDRGKSVDPSSSVASQYNNEPYLFFIDASGSPVTGKTAANFMQTSVFEYDYGTTLATAAGEAKVGKEVDLKAVVKQPDFAVGEDARATVTLPAAKLAELRSSTARKLEGVAYVTFTGMAPGSFAYRLYITTAKGSNAKLTPESSEFAGSFTFFGMMPHTHTTPPKTTVAIPLTDWIRRNSEKLNDPLTLLFTVEPWKEKATEAFTEHGLLKAITIALF